VRFHGDDPQFAFAPHVVRIYSAGLLIGFGIAQHLSDDCVGPVLASLRRRLPWFHFYRG
jgi:hypothetical protein